MESSKKQLANSQFKYIPLDARLHKPRHHNNRQTSHAKPVIQRMSGLKKLVPNGMDKVQRAQKKELVGSTAHPFIDMCWYNMWLSLQLENLPFCLKELRVGGEKLLVEHSFVLLYEVIGDYMQKNDGVSIDEILIHLQNVGILDREKESLGVQRLLVFAILGWKSMLYQAAFNVCSLQELAIHIDSSQPQSGLVFDTYKVAADLCDRPLSVLLKAFGHLLPARCLSTTQLASETTKTASTWNPLYPIETNAYLLHVLLHVKIQWVDSLALHLDYDKSSRTLSLFLYPSFCLEMLHNHGAIYSFASIEGPCADPRANRDDITQYLLEVLLSYRLLFGQSARSRKFFRRIFNPSEVEGYQVDTLLPHLCAQSRIECLSELIPVDRSIYFSARDFPVLFDRVELIANELKAAKPKSFNGLLRDRRDTLQYWTFWLVSIIGGISILLSFVQVVLQGIELMQD